MARSEATKQSSSCFVALDCFAEFTIGPAEGGSRWLAMTVLVSRPHAPIAIFGSASALAFISLSARRYSTGITLRNFGKNSFQFAKISAARFDPVALAWRV